MRPENSNDCDILVQMNSAVLIPRATTVNALTSATGVRYASQGPGFARQDFLHAGADFPGKRGEPVLAIQAGTVVGVYVHHDSGVHEEVSGYASRTASKLAPFKAPFGFGLYVVVAHQPLGSGYAMPFFSGYFHLDQALVRRGDVVKAGQQIAKMGSSGTNPVGGSTHLHLETFLAASGDASNRPNWDCLNPLGFQRWTPTREGNDTPSILVNKVWEVGQVVVTPCFPKSGTMRGVIGVDQPLPVVAGYPRIGQSETSNGLAIVASGPDTPLRSRPTRNTTLAIASISALGAAGLGWAALRQARARRM